MSKGQGSCMELHSQNERAGQGEGSRVPGTEACEKELSKGRDGQAGGPTRHGGKDRQTVVDGELVGLVAEGHELRPGGSGPIDIHSKRDSR